MDLRGSRAWSHGPGSRYVTRTAMWWASSAQPTTCRVAGARATPKSWRPWLISPHARLRCGSPCSTALSEPSWPRLCRRASCRRGCRKYPGWRSRRGMWPGGQELRFSATSSTCSRRCAGAGGSWSATCAARGSRLPRAPRWRATPCGRRHTGETRPRLILAALNQALLEWLTDDPRFLTAIYATVRPTRAGASVQISSAGHPLALVRRARWPRADIRAAGNPARASPRA